MEMMTWHLIHHDIHGVNSESMPSIDVFLSLFN